MSEADWRKVRLDDSRQEEENGGVVLEWAEADFVPDAPRNRKKDGKPFRYVVVRRPRNAAVTSHLPQQLHLFSERDDVFESGSYRYFARVTNTDWDGPRIIDWLNLKQGNIESEHDSVKNGWAGAHFPTSRFGANAAWWRINLLAANLATVLKLRALPPSLRRAKPKTLRFLIFKVGGRVVCHARRIILKLADRLAIASLLPQARAAIRRLAVASPAG